MKACEKADSVTRSLQRITADPPLFDGVKRGLGVFLLLAVPVWLLVVRLVSGSGAQLVWLTGFGVLGMVWIAWRVRRLLALWERQQRQSGTDKQS